jgi:hypothetical protein
MVNFGANCRLPDAFRRLLYAKCRPAGSTPYRALEKETSMKFGLAAIIAATMLAFAAGPAASQSPWPQAEPPAPAPWPQEQPAAPRPAGPSAFDQAPAAQPQAATPQTAAPQAAWPSPQQQQAPQQSGPDPWSQPAGGFGQAQQQQPQDNRCLDQFLVLRKDVEKHGGAIQAASQRKEKPTPQVACGLFNSFTAAEKKMYAYAVKNQASCGIPPAIIDNIKQARAKSDEVRNRICQAAAAGPARAAAPPSLSDALSAPVPDSNNTKTGRGTFDTLTGNPLAR